MSFLDELSAELDRLSERGLRRELRAVTGPQAATFLLEGKTVLNFSSNNYLGLANHDALRAAAHAALDSDGVGAGASRLIAGNLAPHRRLEAKLAHFHGREAALVFNSGYQANVGVLSALAGAEDVVFSYELNHASIIDGCRLSRARVEVFAHRFLDDLERRLRAATKFRRRLIVTDTLFSMDGDLAPLPALRALADCFDAALIVDEAHATGVIGARGRGLADELGVVADVHIATLGKAFGAFGAYVTGARVLIDTLVNRARSFIFTTALPPSVIAAAEAALELIDSRAGGVLRERLQANVRLFANGLGREHATPIFPIATGSERHTMDVTEALLARGVYAQGIRPPTVPAGTSRLRFTLMATHEPAQIERALAALREVLWMASTGDLVELDRQFVWHPFTQMRDWIADEPLIIERADGNWLVDTNGRRFFDGVASLWVNVHGHRRREIDDAVRVQLDKVAHSTLLGLGNVPSIELAAALVKVAPAGLGKVFYSDSGSTSVEIALKIAYQHWCQRGRPEKTRFVALADAYHGDTIGSVSVGGIDLFHQVFRPMLFDAFRVPTPYWYRDAQTPDPIACRDRCLAALARTLDEHGHEIAAFVVEPLVQGAAGMLLHPDGYLARAAELCKAHDVLLVCDEVATGFGRTGTMFACAQEGVTPDILCVAKGITGGYLPLAATLTTDAVYDAFLGPYGAKRTFFHGHTYTGNPLACAAALASLAIFERERTLDALQPKIALLASLLREHVAPLPHVGEIRQRGFMVGIELVRDRATKEEYAYEDTIGARVCRKLREHGVILRPLGTVVVLMPPLSATEDELRLVVDAVRRAIVSET